MNIDGPILAESALVTTLILGAVWNVSVAVTRWIGAL